MLQIAVLGNLRWELDGEALLLPEGKPARALLAWMALHPGEHPRSRVAAGLWPDVLDRSARTSLRGALARINRCLNGGGDAVIATRDTLGLDPAKVEIDLSHFSALVQGGELEAAWHLGNADLLTGLDDEWVYAERDAHHHRLGDVLGRLAFQADSADDLPGAVRWARLHCEHEPHSEEIARELMLLLVRAGDRGAALVVFERLRERLSSDLGSAPSLPTRDLVARLRVAPAEGPPAAAGRLVAPPATARPGLPPLVAARAVRPFVGRDRELEVLSAAWRRTKGGVTHVIAVAGHPGVGKTALSAAFARELHADGATVLFGRCRPEPLTACEPFADALSHVLADAPDATLMRWAQLGEGELLRLLPALAARTGLTEPTSDTAPEGARYRLLAAVDQAISDLAAGRPALIILDDLHWADRSTLTLLTHVVAASRSSPLLLLTTFRRAELGTNSFLAQTVHDLRRDGLLERLTLDGLTAADARELVSECLMATSSQEFAERLREHTDGSPFFIEEILRGWDGAPAQERDRRAIDAALAARDTPHGVHQIIARGLDRVGDEALGVLRLASVLGIEFEFETLAELAGMTADDLVNLLEQPIRARIVEETAGDGGDLMFHHALVRDVIYDGIVRTRRALLHRRAAQAVEALHGDDGAHCAEIAHHLMLAGPDRALEAATWAHSAGDHALTHDDFYAAAVWYQRALDVFTDRPLETTELQLRLGEAQKGLGDRAASRASFLEAATLAREHGDPVRLARAALGFAGRRLDRFGLDEHPEIVLLREALAAVGEDDPAVRAELLARLALAYFMTDPAALSSLATEAAAWAQATESDAATLAALIAEHYAIWVPGTAARRVEITTWIIERVEGLDLVEALQLRANAHFELGDVRSADADLAQHAAVAHRLRTPEMALSTTRFSAMRALLDGRFADAERAIGELVGPEGSPLPPDFEQAKATLMLTLLAERGQLAVLVDQLAELARNFVHVPGWRVAHARALVDAGRLSEASTQLAGVIGPDVAAPDKSFVWLVTMAFAAQVCVATGDVERCEFVRGQLAPYDGLIALAGYAGCWGPVAYHLGTVEAVLGLNTAAAEHFGSASRWCEMVGALPWLARTQLAWGTMLGRDDPAGRDLVENAHGLATRLGMDGIARVTVTGVA